MGLNNYDKGYIDGLIDARDIASEWWDQYTGTAAEEVEPIADALQRKVEKAAHKKAVIRETRTNTFGEMFTMEEIPDQDGELPKLIIVATNNGGGLMPKRLLLPHQLYVHDVEKMQDRFNKVYVLPLYDIPTWFQAITPSGGETNE